MADTKVEKIQALLHEYADNDAVFDPPGHETEQQKNFREDLRAVVSLVFNDDSEIPVDLSSAEIKERLRSLWEKTKPDSRR
jgi:hypothetical protein